MCSISSTACQRQRSRRLLVRAFEVPRVGEKLVRQDRREMLERHRRRKADDGGLALGHRQPLFDLRFELAEVVAGVGSALVERLMLAAVDCFLGSEALDFFGELGRRTVAKSAYALDEKGLTRRKGRR